MVVRCRPELCASTDHEAVNHEEKTITKAETQRILRAVRASVGMAFTYSFYFAHCGTGDDDGQCEKENRGRNVTGYSVGVKRWDHVTDALKYCDVPGADQNREEDAGKRASGDQSRTEQCSRTEF